MKPAGDRPYPASLADKPANQARATAQEASRDLRTIPPAIRLVVSGHSRFCPRCPLFTRAGGTCPGVAAGSRDDIPPLCFLQARTIRGAERCGTIGA